MKTALSIGEYLIQRLYAHGVRHVFGFPGDYVLGFYDQLSKSKLRLINTCDEQGAGFAADAYARVRGLGAVCVTYYVGGLKLANTTAEAFAEKSPVVVISGTPGMKEREKNPLLHHKVREFRGSDWSRASPANCSESPRADSLLRVPGPGNTPEVLAGRPCVFLDCSSIVALLVAVRRRPSSQKRGYLPRARFPVD